MNAPETAALAGVRVLDFSQAMLGPCATQVLGDYGADVIKVERPAGDLMRSLIEDPLGADNPIFLSLNRNKRSIVVDPRSPEGKSVLDRLAATVDVIVSNFRPGVMERLGFGYDDVQRLNGRVVWATGTAYGAEGPFRDRPGVDQLAQAITGLIDRRESDDIPMSIYPTMIVDHTAAMHLVQGILLALLARERTGRGQRVDVSLLDSALSLQMMEATTHLVRGRAVNLAHMPLNGIFPTTDGRLILIGVFRENALRDVSAALDLGEDLSARPEYATLEFQIARKPELQAILRERFASGSTEYWLGRLRKHDLLCSDVRSLAQALNDEQVERNGMLLKIDHPAAGTFRTLASPIHLSETPMTVRYAPPQLGADLGEVLQGLGYTDDEIARLAAEREGRS